KDRTGLVSALLLALAGVGPAAIAEDYALTEEALRPREERWLADGPGDRAGREADLEWGRARAEGMVEVLAGIDAAYGCVEGYLRAVRVSDADVGRLRARLVGARKMGTRATAT